MYMLSHLEPAVELTGGPWYTDNELDSEFIKNLYDTILHYIKERVRALLSRPSPFSLTLFNV
jgi:DNA-directed RNA polymerase III subunit RPC6